MVVQDNYHIFAFEAEIWQTLQYDSNGIGAIYHAVLFKKKKLVFVYWWNHMTNESFCESLSATHWD